MTAEAWHDPSHGQIDRDIQEAVEEMKPSSLAQRVAIERTLQDRRAAGEVVLGVDSHQAALRRSSSAAASIANDLYAEENIRRAPRGSERPLLRLLDVARAENADLRARVHWVEAGPIAEIAAQRVRNHADWGDQSIEAQPPEYGGWLPTLGEEFGEVCRALTLERGDPARLRSELIDVAAVALMWIDSIDRAALVARYPLGQGEPDQPEGNQP